MFIKCNPSSLSLPWKYTWSGGRLTKGQGTTGPDNVWPKVWTQIGNAAQKREKTKNGQRRSQLDNARQMRGIYLLIRRMKNTKKSSRMLGQSWKCVWTRLCRAMRTNSSSGSQENGASLFWCIKLVKRKLNESTSQRVEPSQPKNHENHIEGNGNNSMHLNIRRWKLPDAKAAVDKEWKKLETIPAWQLGRQEQKGGYSGGTKRHRKSTLLH